MAKLLDFGLVREQASVDGDARLTQEGTFSGSPLYMCPEQCKSYDKLDARSDIYSLGAVAYYLVTGRADRIVDAAPRCGEFSSRRNKDDAMTDDPYPEMSREQWDNIVMIYATFRGTGQIIENEFLLFIKDSQNQLLRSYVFDLPEKSF